MGFSCLGAGIARHRAGREMEQQQQAYDAQQQQAQQQIEAQQRQIEALQQQKFQQPQSQSQSHKKISIKVGENMLIYTKKEY